MEFEIGQIFEGMYPPEAAEWCNERGDCYISEIDAVDGVRRFEIKEIPQPTPADKETEFNKQFFNTSLGYVRRKVTMKDGSIKDFLSDILPLLQTGVPIITYNKPDFETSDTPTQNLNQIVTEDFINECKQQVLADFYGAQTIQESGE